MVLDAINYLNPLDLSGLTGFNTDDYWGPWSRDFQATHMARMITVALLVFMYSGTTLRPWLGKFFGALFVMSGAMLWHSFQEVSYYAFAVGGSLAPPWIGNYAPQSMAYEMMGDLTAVLWAFFTSLLLDTPCTYMLEFVHSEKAGKEVEAETAVTAAEAEARAARGLRPKKKFNFDMMRYGGAAFLSCFIYPLTVVLVVPLSMVAMTAWAGTVSSAFRVDILVWGILVSLVIGALYWALIVRSYMWKFGFGKNLKGLLANYFRTCAAYTAGAWVILVLSCMAFSVHSFMGGLEFLQPIYGFGAGMVPSIIFCAVIRMTRDGESTSGKSSKSVTNALAIMRKEKEAKEQ
jgi:hypothetical protein